MENILDRLSKFMKLKELNNNKVTMKAGLSNGLLGNAFKSGKGLSSESIEKILCAYPDINPEWLITGKGSMLKAPGLMTDEEIAAQDKEIAEGKWNVATAPPQAKPSEQPNEGIPLIPLDAMAGAALGELQILEYECERYVVPMFRGAEYLIPVKGDSMQPKYTSGDVVACKNIPLNDLFFEWNRPYVIDTKLGAMIKRIRKGKDDDHVLVVSENTDYEPFELHKSQINAVALVVGVIRLE